MSVLGITQTVLATKLLEAVRKDISSGIDPINLTANKIENGATADWIREVAAHIVGTEKPKYTFRLLDDKLDTSDVFQQHRPSTHGKDDEWPCPFCVAEGKNT